MEDFLNMDRLISNTIVTPAEDFAQLTWLYQYLKGINGFIAGGAFKDIFAGKRVKDLDIFFLSQADWNHARKKLAKRGWALAYENDRCIAFIHPKTKIRVELIGSKDSDEIKYRGPRDTIEMFDFTITKFVLYKNDDRWWVAHHSEYFKHLHLNRLVIDADLVKPLSSFERALKYTKYGYYLCRESKERLITAIHNLPRDTPLEISASLYNGLD